MINLMLGCITVFISMGIQVAFVVLLVRYLLRILSDRSQASPDGNTGASPHAP